jgi:hypothetical protein
LRNGNDDRFDIARENQMPIHQDRIVKQERLNPQLSRKCNDGRWQGEERNHPERKRGDEPICQNDDRSPPEKTNLGKIKMVR